MDSLPHGRTIPATPKNDDVAPISSTIKGDLQKFSSNQTSEQNMDNLGAARGHECIENRGLNIS